jgi:hypothetical protein
VWQHHTEQEQVTHPTHQKIKQHIEKTGKLTSIDLEKMCTTHLGTRIIKKKQENPTNGKHTVTTTKRRGE